MGLLQNTQYTYYTGNNFGNYQFISLNDIIDHFHFVYVGEEKIISNAKRTDIAFHAQRAMQELSFDVFKSCKAQEVTVPASLTIPVPHDYINYTKITWSDSSGIEHVMYPTAKTSNPTPVFQNSDGDYALTADGTLSTTSSSITLDAEYKNILVGMTVLAPSIPLGTVVESTANAGDITTITIATQSILTGATPVAVLPTYSGTETLTFIPTGPLGDIPVDSLILEEESSHIVENLSWNITDAKITAASASDIEDIKVGMLVSNKEFPVGTIVVSVNDTVITTSNLAATAVTSGGEVTFFSEDTISNTWANYKSGTPSENQDDYQDDTYWSAGGQRYGLDPQHAQANGSFYIDCTSGLIHFSSNMNGETVIIHYLSDGLGTDEEMQVHKFAEEAMYKWIAYGILSSKHSIPEYIVNRYKREKFAETRKAKIRLSNIKLEEITQIFRGKSKQIKH